HPSAARRRLQPAASSAVAGPRPRSPDRSGSEDRSALWSASHPPSNGVTRSQYSSAFRRAACMPKAPVRSKIGPVDRPGGESMTEQDLAPANSAWKGYSLAERDRRWEAVRANAAKAGFDCVFVPPYTD